MGGNHHRLDHRQVNVDIDLGIIIVTVTEGLTSWCQTSTEITDVPACIEAVEWGVPLAFRALVASDRIWVQQFCSGWGSCTT